MSQADFIAAANETLDILVMRYGVAAVFKAGERSTVTAYDDEVAVYDEFMPVLKDYIVFLKNGDTTRKTAFESGADYAYRTVWSAKRKRRRYGVASWL